MQFQLKTILFLALSVPLTQNAAYAVDEYNVSKGVTTAGVPLTSLGAVADLAVVIVAVTFGVSKTPRRQVSVTE